jgi:DNA (cytosine-5)-methyltransferase 1
MLENVSEFVHWGPLLPNGRPDPVRRGQSFRRWHKRLENLGYRVDMRELVACDYGAPTSRKRLFVIARCDGGEIVFPERMYGPGLVPYRAAAECIDWSIPCTSIFEREALGKKLLVEPTLRRIARGIWRYVIHDPNPFIAPIPVSANDHSLAVAMLINTRNGERHGRHGEQAPRVRDIRHSYPTITAQGSQGALVLAFLARNYGGHENDGSSLHRPMHVITAKDHHAVVVAFLTRYNGASGPQPLDQPLTTIDTTDRFGIVTVHIKGEPHRIVDIRTRMPEPRELARAQSFRDGYILNPVFKGKPLSKSDQVWMVGNSVPPVVAEALVRANLVEQREEVAA